MLDATSQSIVDRIRSQNRMCEGDLLALRRAIGADLVMDRVEADALFELDQIADKPASWASYFTTVIAAYVDDAQAPNGHVQRDPAVWLIERIDHDGVVETETELALLLNVLRTANYVPDILTSYALSQVFAAVIEGKGRVGQNMLVPGAIGEAEVQLLRQVIYAGTGCGGLRVSRPEAEMLMALNDITNGRDNHPSWQRLFVQAIANYLMLSPTRPMLNAAEAARLATETTRSMAERFSPKANVRAWIEGNRLRDSIELNGVLGMLNESANAEAERVVGSEADWLIQHIMKDGQKNENERALLRFLREECPDVHPSLQYMVDAA